MKKKFLCAVSVIKDEEKFVDEWLVYHKLIGVEHFFLFDDQVDSPLVGYIKAHENYCTVIPWSEINKIEQNRQILAFRYAAINLIKNYEWVIFLDVDEFVVLRQDKNIRLFLSRFPHAAAVSLNWHLFGHNGFLNDPERLITTSLTKRKLIPHHEEKTFSRTDLIIGINSPHFCTMKIGERVDTNGKKFTGKVSPDKTLIAHINHYQCRSFSRWMKRKDRGDVNYIESTCPNSERWRVDEQSLFEKFISDIARNNNELEDSFLSKYKYKIQNGLNDIQRKRMNTKLNPLFKENINHFLKHGIEVTKISDELTTGFSDANGLMAVIFLFHYAKYTNDIRYKNLANSILTKIIHQLEHISFDKHFDYFLDFGISIEYLVKNCFLKKNTNSFLYQIDLIASHRLIQSMDVPLNQNSIVKLLNYYISRLTNPFNDQHHPQEVLNKENINRLYSMIRPEELSLNELIKVLERHTAIKNNFFLDLVPEGFLDRMHSLVDSVINKNVLRNVAFDNDTRKNLLSLFKYASEENQIRFDLFKVIYSFELKFSKSYLLDNTINRNLKSYSEKNISELRNAGEKFEFLHDFNLLDLSKDSKLEQVRIFRQSLFFLKDLNQVIDFPYGLF
ncbi:glycosyltransferase family 2 protein [Pedobacter jejuensis]|uniref:Glycosyltransferase family 2 protein n=1 Tax=Pedobacter jejuensis TaxID=1268550 RepID=A0A3N0BZI7_9SPHI|nr:glycosyltransferase family 2 protein [Pedobacter jejuensis]RNL55411.1 glycosyltransferase family 2 protein [Pedobacter jejuensis]